MAIMPLWLGAELHAGCPSLDGDRPVWWAVAAPPARAAARPCSRPYQATIEGTSGADTLHAARAHRTRPTCRTRRTRRHAHELSSLDVCIGQPGSVQTPARHQDWTASAACALQRRMSSCKARAREEGQLCGATMAVCAGVQRGGSGSSPLPGPFPPGSRGRLCARAPRLGRLPTLPAPAARGAGCRESPPAQLRTQNAPPAMPLCHGLRCRCSR